MKALQRNPKGTFLRTDFHRDASTVSCGALTTSTRFLASCDCHHARVCWKVRFRQKHAEQRPTRNAAPTPKGRNDGVQHYGQTSLDNLTDVANEADTLPDTAICDIP